MMWRRPKKFSTPWTSEDGLDEESRVVVCVNKVHSLLVTDARRIKVVLSRAIETKARVYRTFQGHKSLIELRHRPEQNFRSCAKSSNTR